MAAYSFFPNYLWWQQDIVSPLYCFAMQFVQYYKSKQHPDFDGYCGYLRLVETADSPVQQGEQGPKRDESKSAEDGVVQYSVTYNISNVLS